MTRARTLRFALWSLLLTCGGLGLALAQNAPELARVVYTVSIDGTINPGALGKLQHAINVAEANAAAALIVRIDTPGGLLSTTRDMVSAIAEAGVPVVGYVGPSGASATSAGAFILLSTHVASMNTGTNVGASTPVSGGGEDISGDMRSKVLNDTRAFMRSVAQARGRDARVAESFVTEAASLSAQEARDARVIDLVVDDFAQLLEVLDGYELDFAGELVRLDVGGADVRPVRTRLLDRLLTHLAHPQIAHMLISLGSLAIYIEIISPGLAFPGVMGTISVILGLVCLQTLPVNTGFQILLYLGIAMMIAEYFVAGFGALGVGGALAFVLGSFYLFDDPVPPDYRAVVLPLSIAVGAVMAVTSGLIGSALIDNWKNRRLQGQVGEAMVSFEGEGYVLVAGRRWPADTLEPVRHGDRVVVVRAGSDGRLTVKKDQRAELST
jgi:membrane-bound serine protease (ClpP class)